MDTLDLTLAEHERVIADAMVEVATELRLADPIEIILLVRGEQEANIADLVSSSSELFFKKGSLRYALAADCSLSWGSTPTVTLDMEFHHDNVTAFFRLTLGGRRARVEVLEVLFDAQDGRARSPAERLRGALADARLN